MRFNAWCTLLHEDVGTHIWIMIRLHRSQTWSILCREGICSHVGFIGFPDPDHILHLSLTPN